MRSDRTRPTSDFGKGGSAFEPIRVRGVNSGGLTNRRLKWDRDAGDYTPTTEEIVFYEPDSTTPKQLADGQEAWVIFRPAANRYEEIGGAAGNVIYAQVVSNVADSDPTGSFYNAVGPYVGSIPAGGTGTFININGEEFAADQWVKFFQRKDTGDWHPERGGLAGTIVLRFETTAAKTWDATTVAGVILDASDAPVGGAITLTDRAPAKHEASIGSRGWCVRNGENTYWIITMDSPARWVEGTLAAEWSLGGSFGRIEVVDYWGAAPNHLAPVTYSHDFGDEDVRDVLDVYDPVKVQHRKAFAGEKIRAKWDEKRAKWVLETLPLYITIKGTSPGVTRATSTFTLGTPAAVNGVLPSGTITVKNEPPLDSPSGRTVYARFNVAAGSSVADCWDTGDAGNILELIRGFADWTAGDDQVLDHDADGDPHWHDTGPCDAP